MHTITLRVSEKCSDICILDGLWPVTHFTHPCPVVGTVHVITSAIYLSICLWLYNLFVRPWPLFSFLNLFTFGRTPRTGDQPVSRPLPAHRTTQTQNISTQISMTRVRFEPTIPVFEREKTVQALDRTATVIGRSVIAFS
jgi:hypothetical protein